MMRLIKLDTDGCLTEIDVKPMRREALALLAYIRIAPKDEEERFHYRAKMVPLVERALSGDM